jgi:ParB family chromosome partitioning protein
MTEVERFRNAHRLADVAREDRRRQTEPRVIRPGNGLLLVAEPLDRDDRAEDLVLDDLALLVGARDDGRLVVGARPIRPHATDHDLGAGSGPVDHAGHLVGLGGRDQRAHVEIVRLGRVAPLDRANLVGELRDEVVVDGRSGDHSRGRGAVLAAVPVAGRLERLGSEVEVGVVEDHDRCLAAELEVEALDGPGRDLGDSLARRGVAGDRDHPDLGMRDQLVADRRA